MENNERFVSALEERTRSVFENILGKNEHIEVYQSEFVEGIEVRLWRREGDRQYGLKFVLSEVEMARVPILLLEEKIKFILKQHKWRKNDQG